MLEHQLEVILVQVSHFHLSDSLTYRQWFWQNTVRVVILQSVEESHLAIFGLEELHRSQILTQISPNVMQHTREVTLKSQSASEYSVEGLMSLT